MRRQGQALDEGAGCDFPLGELRSVTGADRSCQAARKDGALALRITAARDERAVVVLAGEAGFACELEDLQAILPGGIKSELTEARREQVVGARWSFPKVVMAPSPGGSIPIPHSSW